jgi:4-hydroxybenzoate polyprenyltransferase
MKVMMVLTWMYDDLGGADENLHVRNFINALGFMCFSSGAGVVSAGYGTFELNNRAYQWIAIIGAIVFSTLSLQDMPDIPGDAARGRRTLPLVYGENAARWLIAVPILF